MNLYTNKYARRLLGASLSAAMAGAITFPAALSFADSDTEASSVAVSDGQTSDDTSQDTGTGTETSTETGTETGDVSGSESSTEVGNGSDSSSKEEGSEDQTAADSALTDNEPAATDGTLQESTKGTASATVAEATSGVASARVVSGDGLGTYTISGKTVDKWKAETITVTLTHNGKTWTKSFWSASGVEDWTVIFWTIDTGSFHYTATSNKGGNSVEGDYTYISAVTAVTINPYETCTTGKVNFTGFVHAGNSVRIEIDGKSVVATANGLGYFAQAVSGVTYGLNKPWKVTEIESGKSVSGTVRVDTYFALGSQTKIGSDSTGTHYRLTGNKHIDSWIKVADAPGITRTTASGTDVGDNGWIIDVYLDPVANPTEVNSVIEVHEGITNIEVCSLPISMVADDVIAPDTPVVETPAEGSTTNENKLSGTAEPNSTVTVTIAGEEYTGETGSDGKWEVTVPGLKDGYVVASVTATDAAGNTSPVAAIRSFTYDTTVETPVITSPEKGALLPVNTVEITGTTELGSKVEVTVGNETKEAQVVGTTWQVQFTDLSEGENTISAVAVDALGNKSDATTSTFTVDTTPPDAPVVSTPKADADTNSTEFSGTAEPGATVTIKISGGDEVTTEADGDGNWSVTVPLKEGPNTAVVTAKDKAGHESQPTQVAFTYDTTAPELAILSPTAGQRLNTKTVAISGTTEKGASVSVKVAGKTYEADVDDNGNWSADVALGKDGKYTATVTATDEAGNDSVSKRSFVLDTKAPNAPTVTTPKDGETTNATTMSGKAEPSSTVVVKSKKGEVIGTVEANDKGYWSVDISGLPEGKNTVTVTATDEAGNTSNKTTVSFTLDRVIEQTVISSPENHALLNKSPKTIQGTAEAYAKVSVTVGGQTLKTKADKHGNWSVSVDKLKDGVYKVSAVAVDAAGNESKATSRFTLDTKAPNAPKVTTPANGSTVNTKTIAGKAEAKATITVTIDGVSYTTTANARGNWNLTVELEDGLHNVKVTATDAAGNKSKATKIQFTLDTVNAPLSIDSPYASQWFKKGEAIAVSGEAEVGAVVTVTISSNTTEARVAASDSWSETVTSVDGTWAVTPELADGSYTVSATSVDAAGNPATATPVRFQVDTVAPEAPAIDLPTDGTPVAGKTIYGSAEVGDTVTVTIDGTDYEAKVDTSGRWSVDIDGLEDGPHTIIATATDEAGNSSETTVNFTLDNTAPSNPVITIPAHNGDTNKDKAEGTAEPGSTVTIVIDGQTTVTTKAGDDGKWEVTLPGLGQGEHTLVATATDEAGNVSGETKSKFKYDTVAPAEPVITTPKADETVTTDEITVSGTAEPGSTVTIYVDGKEHGTATADAEGKWSHEIKGLDNGKYQIEVTATDKAGNTSAKKKLEFTRDYTADPDINGGGGSNDHDTNSGGNSGGSGDDGSGSGGSDSDGDLPFTGSDTLPLLGIGGLLTALGGAFAAIRKRRK